jgi:hypothetical protein
MTRQGLALFGSAASQNFGFSVEVGDVNGDGVMDIIGGTNVARSTLNARNGGMVTTLYGTCTFSKVPPAPLPPPFTKTSLPALGCVLISVPLVLMSSCVFDGEDVLERGRVGER